MGSGPASNVIRAAIRASGHLRFGQVLPRVVGQAFQIDTIPHRFVSTQPVSPAPLLPGGAP